MSIEKALIARSQPIFLATKAEALIEQEASKGCKPSLYHNPVPLEPPLDPVLLNNLSSKTDEDLLVPSVNEISSYGGQSINKHNSPINLRVWVSPEQAFNWTRTELFIKSLKNLKHRAGFEIAGNSENIELSFLIHEEDLSALVIAFKSQFNQCELTLKSASMLSLYSMGDWQNTRFYDYYPLPPYSHLFTQPHEFKVTPLDILFTALAEIKPPVTGFYQMLFQGTAQNHDWHRNINILLDFEYAIKLMSGLPMSQRIPFQPPSGELKGMAQDTENKAHNDKPIYAAAMRIGVIGGDIKQASLRGLNLFANLFQHGGRPLQSVSYKEYNEVIEPEAVKQMFLKGLTYRPGFILNSSELSGMVHLPPAKIFKPRQSPITLLETLPVRNIALLNGTPIGISNYANSKQIVCIPPINRACSTHLIGRPGMGKSTLLEQMIMHDITAGSGVAVLDPHGDLINRLLNLIPEKYIDRTIYFFPGDPNWVPLWNPVNVVANQDVSRTADDLVAAIKNIVQGWGDRLENLLRHAIYALLLVPGSSLLDVANLLRKNSAESRRLIGMIKSVIENETSRAFWHDDFSKYNNQDLNPPQHKLSKLLMSGTVSLMLSQPENKINFREIMDTGKILLIDLSGIGSEVRELLGSFMLSLLHITSLSRSDIDPLKRKQFHIFCDEAHRFLSSSFEDMVVETRKFRVSLTLAHQYLRQFDRDVRDAILTAGSTIIFNVDLNDARYLTKDLQDLVKPEDLATFEVGEAIARIGTDIVKIKTTEQESIPANNYYRQIIAESHRRYYRPIKEIKTARIGNRAYPDNSITSFIENESPEDIALSEEAFKYDEFK